MPSNPLQYDSTISLNLLEDVELRSGQNLKTCYQCRRCAAGCPVGEQTGVTPDRLIRKIVLGDTESVINNLLVWKCVSCYTCGARCPNNIQTAKITEALKQMCKQANMDPVTPRIAEFHDAFMKSVRHFGRFNEIEGMVIYETKSAINDLMHGRIKEIIDDAINQAKLAFVMSLKKRTHIGIDKIKNRSELRAIFEKAKKERREK